MHPWFLLCCAIALEVAGTTALKFSQGMTLLVPSVVSLTLYTLSLATLGVAVKTLEIGLAYAIWSGLGTTAIAAIGVLWFGESATPLKLFSLGLVIAGVVGLNLSAGHN